MIMDWVNWLLVGVATVFAVLLLVDAALVEIPRVRKLRGLLGGLVVFIGGVVVGRGLSGEDEGKPDPADDKEVEPETFDDEPVRKADAEASDLDLDAAADDRELDDLVESNDELRRRLEESQAVQDSLGDSE